MTELLISQTNETPENKGDKMTELLITRTKNESNLTEIKFKNEQKTDCLKLKK